MIHLTQVPPLIRETVQEFIEDHVNDPLIAGALLTGSYATGIRVSKYSDIDISFVLVNAARTRKRGSKILNGYLVEYTADPFRYIHQLFNENRAAGIRHIARKYATGIILLDREGVADLQQKAMEILQQPIIKLADDPQWVEMAKYYLLDQLLNLRALHEESSRGFQLTYFAHVQKILDTYGKFSGVEVLRPERVHQMLTDQEFCAKYGIEQFPDCRFTEMVVACIERMDIERLIALNCYVLEKMGGFVADEWLFESHCP